MFTNENIHRSIFSNGTNNPKDANDKNYVDINVNSSFSFSRFCDYGPNEMTCLHSNILLWQFINCKSREDVLRNILNALTWQKPIFVKHLFLLASKVAALIESKSELIVTNWVIC